MFSPHFAEGHALRALLTENDRKEGQRHLDIPISIASYDVFHNLLFSIYTGLIAPDDVIKPYSIYGFLADVRPEPCDLEELYRLMDQYEVHFHT